MTIISFNFLNIFFLSDEDPGTLETPTHANNVTIPHQSGSGFGLDNISLNQIASIVAEKLKPTSTQLPDFRPLLSTFPLFDRPEPPVAAGQDDSVEPPVNYDNTITKTDLNDKADERKVLHCVPKKYWPNAIRLLRAFDEKSEQLTYDCSGTIYVDQVAIPGSNIFLFMPLLFKKKHPTLPGFADFVAKITDMGLDHFMTYRLKEVKLVSKSTPISESTASASTSSADSMASNDNWWYIGP